MSRIEDAELRQLKKERNQSEIEVTAAMNSFAREISEGGLGAEMMTELTAPPKKESWIKRFFKNIFYTI
jgi:hypothetical protein